jgi:amidohydrolase
MTAALKPPADAPFDSLFRHITALRHDLHRHPELGYNENYTSQLVERELRALGLHPTTGLAGGTGITALIHGNGDGPCVALRADMDALPILETTALPYASESRGLMHACGHDGHTSILLGAAAILVSRASTFRGTIKLIFQPAEEGGKGALRMCNEGVLDAPRVDAIFGLHGWPGMKIGTVGTRPGPLLASVDSFDITLTGRGGHAATPHDTIDPIVCAAALVQSLQTIVAREIDPSEPCVVTVGQLHAGSAFNIIPDVATLGGTVRALSSDTREKAVTAIKRLCREIAHAYRCTAAVNFNDRTPVTTNDPALAEFFRETAIATLGPARVISMPKAAMWGEDFAFYLDHVPGCFFTLGLQPLDQPTYPTLHNSNFDFNDAAIPVGVEMMTQLALHYLAR